MTFFVRLVHDLSNLVPQESAASGPLKLALAVTLGLVLGAVRIRGFKLGVSAVLFAGLALGQLGVSVRPEVLSFVRDFSLILFVYAIGLQVGPGFIESFRSEGLRLNLLALAVVVLGAIFTTLACLFGGLPHHAASGLYAGAFTTTPGLAAGQEVLRQVLSPRPDAANAAMALTGLAYAVSYPFGVVGPSFVIVLLQRLFKIDLQSELTALFAAEQVRRPPIHAVDIEITALSQTGVTLRDHPLLRDKRILFSRLLRDGALSVSKAQSRVQVGDIFRAVGTLADLEEAVNRLGRRATQDLGLAGGGIQRIELVVTRPEVLRRPLRDLDLTHKTGFTIGRINRSGVELLPSASVHLKFGDRAVVIGPEEGLALIEKELGNSQDSLNRPQLLPIFLGIVLGVIIGAAPLKIPGLSLPMQIGLAGGPMLAAIALSQLGSIGSVIWYMPVAASQLFRDFGLAVFLACVGFESGPDFLQRALHGGMIFIVWGIVITLAPVLLVAFVARRFYKMNFVTLTGLIAGAMTSSPGLIFANELAGSDAASLAYATVAPLCMLGPIICAQLLAVGLTR